MKIEMGDFSFNIATVQTGALSSKIHIVQLRPQVFAWKGCADSSGKIICRRSIVKDGVCDGGKKGKLYKEEKGEKQLTILAAFGAKKLNSLIQVLNQASMMCIHN